MKKSHLIGATIVFLLAGVIYYVATADSRNQIGSMMTYEEAAPENTTMGDHSGHGATTGITEQQFLEHMIPHHEEAISSSKLLLSQNDLLPETKTLAEEIIKTQVQEVAQMKAWYEAWYQVPYKDNGTYKPMMRDLSSLSPKDLEQAYLEDMIAHHTGALTQAQAVAPNASHQEILALAQNIATTQSNEIITMRIILNQMNPEPVE